MQVWAAKKYFDRWAARYDRDLERFNYTVPQAVSAPLADGHVLDVGIGTGLCSAALKARYPDIVISGVDASAKMLAVCRAKGIAQDLWQVNVATDPLPYGDQIFDGVMCGGLAEFLQSPQGLLREVARVLKPGGTFTLAFEGPEEARMYRHIRLRVDHVEVRRISLWPYPWIYRKYLHDAEAMQRMCRDAGLDVHEKRNFQAYARPNGQVVWHWILVCKKPAV